MPNPAQPYYKVLLRKNELLLPSFIGNYDEMLKYCPRYKVGEWIGPVIEGSGLFVFTDLKSAQRYLAGWGNCIYECEVKNPREKYKMSAGDWWKIKSYLLNEGRSINTVGGMINTAKCDLIKLIKEV